MKTWFRKMTRIFAVFAFVIALGNVHAYPARTATGVVDETGSLSSNDLLALEALLSDARAKGEDIGVVVLNTLDGADPRAYATALFNAWGLGQAKSNRGVLVLVAVQDRAAELILGSGIDGPDQQAISERIMRDTMVPEFRAGRYAGGAFRGAERAAAEILLLPSAMKSAEQDTQGATAFAPPSDATPVMSEPSRRQAPQPQVTEPLSFVKSFWAAIVALPMLALAAGATAWSWFRRRKRNCRLCHRPMQRLDETADDLHLSASARVEEKLGSIDYDVWRCTACPHAEILSYRGWFSSYKHCPSCKAKTLKCENNVVYAPTYTATGGGKITEDCQACQHHFEKAYVISRRVAQSSSSSSSSSSRSNSGGGSSRGGGASGRW